MKIYTRTGDSGETSVIGGRMVKDHDRVEAYGTVDELNSTLGLSISYMYAQRYTDLIATLQQVQHELFDCGTDLATLPSTGKAYLVNEQMVSQLEQWIDKYDQETSDITRFILPGGSIIASSLHVSRTVCRRAERRVISLQRQEATNPDVTKYLNRLSDLLFTVARVANHREEVEDVTYVRSAEVFKNPS